MEDKTKLCADRVADEDLLVCGLVQPRVVTSIVGHALFHLEPGSRPGSSQWQQEHGKSRTTVCMLVLACL